MKTSSHLHCPQHLILTQKTPFPIRMRHSGLSIKSNVEPLTSSDSIFFLAHRVMCSQGFCHSGKTEPSPFRLEYQKVQCPAAHGLIAPLNEAGRMFSHLLSKSTHHLHHAGLWLTYGQRGRKAYKYSPSFLNLNFKCPHYTVYASSLLRYSWWPWWLWEMLTEWWRKTEGGVTLLCLVEKRAQWLNWLLGDWWQLLKYQTSFICIT